MCSSAILCDHTTSKEETNQFVLKIDSENIALVLSLDGHTQLGKAHTTPQRLPVKYKKKKMLH